MSVAAGIFKLDILTNTPPFEGLRGICTVGLHGLLQMPRRVTEQKFGYVSIKGGILNLVHNSGAALHHLCTTGE